MTKFELKVEVKIPYIKTIRFFGAIMMGVIVGATLIKYKNGSDINWVNTSAAILPSFILAIFPTVLTKKFLMIDEHGINNRGKKLYWGKRNRIKWENISAIGVDRNNIHIMDTIGTSERISVPIHAEEQISNLKTYLKEVAMAKDIKYLGDLRR